MQLLKKIGLIIFLVVSLFVVYTLVSTGFFRIIEPRFDGEILKKVALKGAEDMMVSRQDRFVLISATDRANLSEKKIKEGGLFLIDLKVDDYSLIPLTNSLNLDLEPHGISFFKKDSTYHVLVVNHANESHTIEVFELKGNKLLHKRTLKDESMVQPNDLVMIDEHRFYFTNDHGYTKGIGKFLEEYLGLAISNVVYFDGENYREVAKGIAYANGINIDRDRNLLFVASARKFLVKVYAKQADGSLSFIEDIPCGTGVDNIEFDEKNNLWIGCHPSLLRYNAYSKGKKEISPSEIIKINYYKEGDYTIEKVYIEEGNEMSGSTVAAIFNDLIFVGNVMDDEFLVLKRNYSVSYTHLTLPTICSV